MFAEDPKVTKTCGTICLVIGSVPAYAFILKIFARIWDPEAYLFPGLVAAFAGIFLCGGVLQNARWRKPLGIIWICLAGLAAFNSMQSEALTNVPVHGLRTGPLALQAVSRASIVMSVAGATLGLALLFWQRRLDRSDPEISP